MIVHPGLPERPIGDVVLAIGSFDGIHLGHQHVLDRVKELAAGGGSRSAVITFEPHPRCVLEPAACPKSITTLEEKLGLLHLLGIDDGIVLKFTPQVAQLSPEDFIAALGATMTIQKVVCGPDFGFGHRRHGNPDWLREHGVAVEVVEPIEMDGTELHSSEIRRLLGEGDVPAANRLLGRPFVLRGTVEHGAEVGRGLGFPTANLTVQLNKLVPVQGIYAVRVKSPGGRHLGALNIGYRPTFGGDRLTIEVYLLDFDGDLYGQQLEVSFVARLRDEKKFGSAEELAEAIARDVAETRRLLER
ncbi:MAG: bifunctional riboflavin kinase/FAD synthetase [Candidatus Dormibacteraeota bacterium]|nr:bifunctional riboflavin kinase/FAD synthetase [Candidatus Dormibacteraeota bacterium]